MVSLCDLKLFRFDNVINGNSRIKLDIADKYNFDFAYLSALLYYESYTMIQKVARGLGEEYYKCSSEPHISNPQVTTERNKSKIH